MAVKQRVEYIDLMKGIVIILVVMFHCELPVPEQLGYMLSYARMPLYIFLSGLFFSTYGSFKRLLVKKTNKLVVPFIAFNVLYIVLLPFLNEYCSLKMIKGCIFALVTFNFTILNSPLWFLVLLFLMSLMVFGLEILLRNRSKFVKIVISVVISFLAFNYNTFIWSDIAEGDFPKSVLYKFVIMPGLILQPLYYTAYLFRGQILCEHKHIYLWLMLLVAIILWYVNAEGPAWFYGCFFTRNYLKLCVLQISSIYVIFFIGYMIKRLPYVSYLGRYSIIVLCTHKIVLALGKATLHIYDERLLFIIVLATAPLLIWLLKRYLPHFTAQKDLIKIQDNGKVKISFMD